MISYRCKFICLISLLSLSIQGASQTFSYDGNRWYEIEVSIFSNENGDFVDEKVIEEKINLVYPEVIRQLIPASSSFVIPFQNGFTSTDELLLESSLLFAGLGTEPVAIGPQPAPSESGFKLIDFTRDPFISLGAANAEFLEHNRRINESVQHRLLFHAVWRQPLLNRVQSSAIVIAAGESNADHHELEGSLLFSYNVNRVDLETQLWLAEFGRTDNPERNGSPARQIPAAPYPVQDDSEVEADMEYSIIKLSIMNQVRSMTSNSLHFLDHPDFGLLVEIRPYQLPQPENFIFE